jgi:hypothetical protein
MASSRIISEMSPSSRCLPAGRRTRLGWTLMVALAAIMFVAVPTVATAAQVTSPRALYKALLAGAIPRSQLPAGFHSSTTNAIQIGALQKRHHAVGEVSIDLSDDDQNASIVYVVFPTRADALGNFADGLKDIRTQKGVTIGGAARGLPKPSVVVRISGLGQRVTQVSFVVGNVGVNAFSVRGLPEATSLALLGLKHLNAVR